MLSAQALDRGHGRVVLASLARPGPGGNAVSAFRLSPGRGAAVGPLLFTDFDSQDVRVIGTADLAWLGQRDR